MSAWRTEALPCSSELDLWRLPSALVYAGLWLLLRRWDGVTGELVKGLGSVLY